jgi:hypothetical protein
MSSKPPFYLKQRADEKPRPKRPISRLTASGRDPDQYDKPLKAAREAQPTPAQRREARGWPYNPSAETMVQWCNTAVNHFVAIRATGSVPALGGPSCGIQLPATADGIHQAGELAESYWPNARSFDLLGADLEYKSTADTEGLAPGFNRLRNAIVITTFEVTDRPPVEPPTAPAGAAPQASPPQDPAQQQPPEEESEPEPPAA